LLVTHELEIASGIQRSLLPTHLPEPAGYRFAGHSRSANEVGGDFYDVIELPGDGILLAIADVMGKGVPAAMFASILRSQIRARPDLAAQPGGFLRWLNAALFRDLDRVDMFVTAQLAFLNLASAELCVASAGHCPLLLASVDSVQHIHPDGLPLGITPDSVYPEQRVSLQAGIRALLYTDGLVELRNPENQALGLPALQSRLQETARADLPAPDTRAALVAFAREFQRQANARDDLTFLVITPHLETSAPPGPGSNFPV
jgi:serine phosphatase RsbU (regulator of sigma subunit)